MVDAFYADNNRIQVIKNDDVSFDSQRPSIQLLPETSIINISRNVTFPSLLDGITYLQRTYGSTPYCESWSSLLPQEWGPNEVNFSPTMSGGTFQVATRTLAREVIGSVPSGTDYIDVRAKMTRTTSPPVFMQQSTPPVMFQEGQWIGLPGGSCPCEYFVPLARHFDIVLEGTTLYLDRYQSVRNGGERWFFGGNPANQYGWFINNTATYAAYSGAWTGYGTPASLIQTLSGDIFVNRRAPWAFNSTGACSTTRPDYTSVYSCEFEIRPGRYKPSV